MEEREVELIDYINVILKRKGLILIGTLLCVFAAAIYSYTRTESLPLYEAKASVVVTSPPFKGEFTPPSLPVTVYEKLARAQDLEQAVIDSLGLKRGISELDGMLTVETLKEGTSPLITFSIKSDDPDLSVRVANKWADLFVRMKGNSALQTVTGSYDFIINQYDTARKRLEETEDAILSSKTNNSQVAITNERAAEVTKLNEIQTLYTNQLWDLKAKEAALKQQDDLLTAVEINGKLVTTLVEEEHPVSFGGLTESQRKIRKLIVDTKQDAIQAEKELLAFNVEHRVELLKVEVDKKSQMLTAHQTELVDIELNQKTTLLDLEQVDQQLQQQSPGLALSKAITDDALWQRVRDGAPSPDDVKKLEALKLRSEEINPIYVDLLKRKTELQLAYNSYAPKEVLFKEEVQKLKKEIPALQERLRKEEMQQASLVKKVENARAIFNVYQENYTTTKVNVEKLRLEVESLRKTLAYNQSAQEMARSKVLGLDEQISFRQTEQARLDRETAIYKSTFERFAKLVEDARITRAGEVSDLKVVMRAGEAAPAASTPKGQNTILLAGAVGLIASTFLAFFIEYMEKARQRTAEDKG